MFSARNGIMQVEEGVKQVNLSKDRWSDDTA